MPDIANDTGGVNPPVPAPATITKFLGWQFGRCSDGVVEIGWKTANGPLKNFRRFPLGDWDAIAAFAAETNRQPGHDIYIRPATVRSRDTGFTTDADFVQACALWVDLDNNVDSAKQVATMFRPTGVTVTGTKPEQREQWYYNLDTAVTDGELVRSLNRRFCLIHGGDKAVVNPTSLMRLPGSVSWPKDHKPGRVAELTTFTIESKYAPQGYPVAFIAKTLPHGEEPKEKEKAVSAHGLVADDVFDVAAALQAIPNSGKPEWNAWNNLGMAVHAATGGSDAGFVLWDAWSAKNQPHHNQKDTTRSRWDQWNLSPPDKAGAGKLFYLAKQTNSTWVQPSHRAPSAAAQFEADPPDAIELCQFLDIHEWTQRDIPPADRLLGDFVTTTTRCFIVGRTGLGKTLFGLEASTAMASGAGFLHWASARPARVLYVDGEMPAELIKSRAIDAIRRAGKPVPAGNLIIFARDSEEEFTQRFPTLGKFEPLNTEAGREFMLRLVSVVQPDVVVFDNVMSLVSGDQKDEIPWSETLPLVSALTAKRIGQVWLDHTGHNSDRQYGSSTKAWRFDAVAVLTPVSEQQAPGEVAFTLSFDHPGKARRRTPRNWHDFETRTVRIRDDRWISEPVGGRSGQPGKVSDLTAQFHGVLLSVFRSDPDNKGWTTREAWYAECARIGLVDPIEQTDSNSQADAKRSKLRRIIRELSAAKWIRVDDKIIFDALGRF